MISIRKQLFSIFLSIGLVMLLTTSLMVNVSIKKNFELYINNTIQSAADDIVRILEKLYEEHQWDDRIKRQAIVENYMGEFSVAVLSADKEFLWGTTDEEFEYFVQNIEDGNVTKKEKAIYRLQDREITSNGEVVGYVRIGYCPTSNLSMGDKKFQKDVNMSILWCSSMILMWFILSGLYISRLFTYHIYGISKTSIAIADGKLNARYPFKSKIKEIETLRHSMNYLGEKLERQDQIRKKLISDVSHEIRTPLHILQSNLEAMIDGIYPIDEEQLNVLYQEVVRFGKLLNNLDLLKNVEESESRMDFKLINLNESINEVFDAFKIVAKEKKISYHIKCVETEKVMIMGDKDALKQLWMNLLSNAFKFTGPKGEIKVSTAVFHKECIITVEDTGIGIAQEDIPFIFERMYRGDKSREQYEGSGLGLTLVKNIVDRHQGKVDVVSEEGKFTRMMVTLPVSTFMLEPNNISSKMKSYIRIGNKGIKQ